MTTTRAVTACRRIALPLLAQAVLVVLVGLLITHPPHGWWDPAADGLTGRLAELRTPAATRASAWFSLMGSTGAVVAVTILTVAVLLLGSRLRRWREASFLACAVSAQALVFLLATVCVERARPDVVRLDASPPTSSFPSGHTGAAMALYGGLAVLAALCVTGRWRVPLCVLAGLVPLLVGASRLYRGMHHPGDVLTGLLNGAGVLWIMWRAFLDGREEQAATAAGSASAVPASGATGPVGDPVEAPDGRPSAVVVHQPQLVDRRTLDEICRVLARHGHPRPRIIATTAEDPGRGAAARAVAEGVPLVVACGGDGTVTACAGALAGSATALAVVPCGTGNLLARNLRLPSRPGRALDTALAAGTRRIDLARTEGDGLDTTRVSAMAGIGLDAAIMADTGRTAKRRLGWPAYLLPVARHLGDRRMAVTVTLDDRPPLHRHADMALIGNVGALQGGVRLLPDAEPDDGLLDLVLLHPRGPGGWLAAVAQLATGRHRAPHDGSPRTGAPFEHFRARRIALHLDADRPRELDGEPVAPGRTLTLTVEPAALLVHAPQPARRPVRRPTRRSAAPDAPDAPAHPTGRTGPPVAVPTERSS
ncbi:diacylglycerol kinase family protein [Kitasatospora sp. NE20-6]|uniref:diacylglycerol kinase family protein n=1 Tax=Kitasatospora sp. NE20-6 TaxID=2859066 RepID=UPI0038B31098